jgi:hypothetical protein
LISSRRSYSHRQDEVLARLQTHDDRVQRFKQLGGIGMQQSLSDSSYHPSPADSLSSEMSRQQDLQRGLHDPTTSARLPAGVLSGIHFAVADAGRNGGVPSGADSHGAGGGAAAGSGYGYSFGQSDSPWDRGGVAPHAGGRLGGTTAGGHSFERRDPILATGDLQISHGYDGGERAIQHRLGGQHGGGGGGGGGGYGGVGSSVGVGSSSSYSGTVGIGVRRNVITGENLDKTHGFDAYRRPVVAMNGQRNASQINLSS